MRYCRLRHMVWTTAIALLAGGEQAVSAPEDGAKVGPLKVAVCTGERAGQEVDVVADRGDRPTVFVFVRADTWDRPAARYLRTIDEALVKGAEKAANASVVAIWLTDELEKSKQYLPVAQQSLQLEKTTWAVYPGDPAGPNGWSISSDSHVTTVVVRAGKVVASFNYISLNETDVPEVVKALQK